MTPSELNKVRDGRKQADRALALAARDRIPLGFDPLQMELDGATYANDPAAIKSALSEITQKQIESDTQLHPFRCFVFWRTTRWLMSKQGRVQQGQRLGEAEQLMPNVFEVAVPWTDRGSMDRLVREIHVMMDGRPVTPHARDLLGDKDGISDVIAGHLIAAQHLEVSRGSNKQPHIGVKGLQHVDPKNVPYALRVFPSPRDLINFEDSMIDRVARMLSKRARRPTVNWLREFMGFTIPEVEEVMKLADQAAVRLGRASRQEQRAHMIAYLEEMLARARKALNMSLELSIARQLSKVQGIEGIIDDDAMDMRRLAAVPIEYEPEDESFIKDAETKYVDDKQTESTPGGEAGIFDERVQD